MAIPAEIPASAHTIVLVGASSKAHRPSHRVMRRRAEYCPAVAEEAVSIGAQALWLQLGIVSPEARAIAEQAEMDYVEDECTAIVHRRAGREAE